MARMQHHSADAANAHSRTVAHSTALRPLTLVHDTLELSQQEVQADATQVGIRAMPDDKDAECRPATVGWLACRSHCRRGRHPLSCVTGLALESNLRLSRNECVSAQGGIQAPHPQHGCAWVFRCTSSNLKTLGASNLITLSRGGSREPLSLCTTRGHMICLHTSTRNRHQPHKHTLSHCKAYASQLCARPYFASNSSGWPHTPQKSNSSGRPHTPQRAIAAAGRTHPSKAGRAAQALAPPRDAVTLQSLLLHRLSTNRLGPTLARERLTTHKHTVAPARLRQSGRKQRISPSSSPSSSRSASGVSTQQPPDTSETSVTAPVPYTTSKSPGGPPH